jgi:hypothetical protein
MRPMLVVVPRVLGQDPPEVSFAVDQQVVKALAPQCSHIPLRKGIARGDRTGALMIRTPLPVNTSSNAGVNLLSLSFENAERATGIEPA